MKAGTILFRGTDLCLYGSPTFSLRHTPDPPPPNRATKRQVLLTINMELHSGMPATQWARARELMRMLSTGEEGLVEILDENEAQPWTMMMRPGDSTLPDAVKRFGGSVELVFHGTEYISSDSLNRLALTVASIPTQGMAQQTVRMEEVLDWSEASSILRPDNRHSARSELTTEITFKAHTGYVNPDEPAHKRLQNLHNTASYIKDTLTGAQGLLSYAGFSKTVEFQSLKVMPDPNNEHLIVEASCSYTLLPHQDKAEASFTVETAEESSTRQVRTVITGTVEASSKAAADERISAIHNAWLEAGHHLKSRSSKDSHYAGADTQGASDWHGRQFTLEYTKQSGNEPNDNITLSGISGTIIIEQCTSWIQNTRINRHDSRGNARSSILTNVTFSGRSMDLPSSEPLSSRMRRLAAEANRLNKAAASADSSISHGGFSGRLQVESFSAKPSGDFTYLEIEGQARSEVLPGRNKEEVDFRREQKRDSQSGETRTTISGQARAHSRDQAQKAAEDIRKKFLGANRFARMTSESITDTLATGEDYNNTEGWHGMDFTFEFAQPIDQSYEWHTLEVQDIEGQDGKRKRWSGTITAPSLVEFEGALKKLLQPNDALMETQRDITLQYETAMDNEKTPYPRVLVKGSFSVEYIGPSEILRGSVQYSTRRPNNDLWIRTASGTVSAKSRNDFERFIKEFIIPADVVVLTEDINESGTLIERKQANQSKTYFEEAITTYNFTLTWNLVRDNVCISYQIDNDIDYMNWVNNVTVTGSVYAKDEDQAKQKLKELLERLQLKKPSKMNIKNAFDQSQKRSSPSNQEKTTIEWRYFNFTASFHFPIEDKIPGMDLMECSVSIQRIGMVNHIPITEIFNGKPIRQKESGYNLGIITISGHCKARKQETAILWGQEKYDWGKKAMLSKYEGAPNPPEEILTPTYLLLDGQEILCYEFRFNYSFRHDKGLEGLLPQTGYSVIKLSEPE